MKTSLTYGFFMALGTALLTLVLYFLNFHSDPEKLPAAQMIGALGGLAICWACVCLGLRDSRTATAAAGNDWGYGSAFGQGTMIVILGVLFSAVFSYFYFNNINVNFSTVVHDAQVTAMEAKGMSPEQIERAEGMMKKFISPTAFVIFGIIGGVFNGLILTAHLSLTMIRKHTRSALFKYYAIIGAPVGVFIGFFQGMQHGHALMGAGIGLIAGPIVEVIAAAIAFAVTNYAPKSPEEPAAAPVAS